jgi:hypothetical protein
MPGRDRDHRGIVSSGGFERQDAGASVRRQAVAQQATRGSGPADDEAVHARLPPNWPGTMPGDSRPLPDEIERALCPMEGDRRPLSRDIVVLQHNGAFAAARPCDMVAWRDL